MDTNFLQEGRFTCLFCELGHEINQPQPRKKEKKIIYKIQKKWYENETSKSLDFSGRLWLSLPIFKSPMQALWHPVFEIYQFLSLCTCVSTVRVSCFRLLRRFDLGDRVLVECLAAMFSCVVIGSVSAVGSSGGTSGHGVRFAGTVTSKGGSITHLINHVWISNIRCINIY